MKIAYANEYNKNVKLNVDTNNLEYQYGYAVIEKRLSETELMKVKLLRNAPKTIMGVIDEKENVIVPFKDYYNHIDIFANNNFIITTKSTEHMVDVIKIVHFHYNGSEIVPVHEFSGRYYKPIDDGKIIIKESDSKGDNYSAIYDVDAGKFISDKFDTIGGFETINNKDVALACRRLNPLNDNTNIYCYIDKNGNIVSPIYNSFTTKYAYANNYEYEYGFDFEAYVSKSKEELSNKCAEDENIIKNVLTKKIGV